MDFLKKPGNENLLHVFLVAPLLYSIGNNSFPEEYKPLLVKLAIGIALYHAYLYAKKNNMM